LAERQALLLETRLFFAKARPARPTASIAHEESSGTGIAVGFPEITIFAFPSEAKKVPVLRKIPSSRKVASKQLPSNSQALFRRKMSELLNKTASKSPSGSRQRHHDQEYFHYRKRRER
jgi:hypothetical protein